MRARPRPRREAGAPPRRDRGITLLLWITAAAALLVPVVAVDGGDGFFRTPKELLVRLEAILLAAGVAVLSILGRSEWRWREVVREPWAILTAAAIGWTAVTAIASPHRMVTMSSLAYVAAMAVVFAVTLLVLRRAGTGMALVPMIPAAVNVVVLFLQHFRLWNPWVVTRTSDWRPTGLIGNTGDTGCYLMVACIAAAALAMASKRWRWTAAGAALLFALGTFLTATLTAVGSLVAGLVVLAAMRSFRLVVVTIVIVALLGAIAFVWYPPVQQRYERISGAMKTGNLDEFFSFRFVGYLTAWMMAVDHPVTGVGPGAYGTEFFDYRDRAEARFPFLKGSGARMWNFGEAHNDHLQVMAQSGVPGYLLFLAALVLLGKISLRRDAGSEEARYASTLALPLAVSFGVLTLAQFPLELAAPLHTALFYAAAAGAWSTAE